VTLASILAVLALSANTSFADFPRLCRIISEDGFLPRSFGTVGRRLVYSNGIVVLAVLSGVLLVLFGGITDRLIPLFAVGAFSAFTLSQAGMVVHWRRAGGGAHSKVAMAINGVGAAATGVALAVILVAKFAEGAWMTVVLVPAILALFAGVKRHYRRVLRQIACLQPLDFSGLEPPIVVVPIETWDMLSVKALRFGLRISNDVRAVHVGVSEAKRQALQEQWDLDVEQPAQREGRQAPRLIVLPSPYRRFFLPLIDFVRQLEKDNPAREIAVIIPELVQRRWYEAFLHNHRAEVLKARLLLEDIERVALVNIPWYLK
jgi:MFS family permease